MKVYLVTEIHKDATYKYPKKTKNAQKYSAKEKCRLIWYLECIRATYFQSRWSCSLSLDTKRKNCWYVLDRRLHWAPKPVCMWQLRETVLPQGCPVILLLYCPSSPHKYSLFHYKVLYSNEILFTFPSCIWVVTFFWICGQHFLVKWHTNLQTIN